MSLESTIRSVMTESKEDIQEDEYSRLDTIQSKLRKMIDAYRQDKLPKNKVREMEMLQKEVKKLMAKLYYTEEVEMEDLDNLIEEALSEADDFKPHMMYDPKTGKAYKAEKPEDHERMAKMGYTHEKPKMDESLIGGDDEWEEAEEVEEHTHYKMDTFGNSVSLLDAVNAVLSGKVKRENIPEEILDDDVADFIGAASKAAQAGKKTFKFGDKEYPVTIKKDTAKKVASKMEDKHGEDKKMKDKKDEKMGKKEPIEIDPAIKEALDKDDEPKVKEIVKKLKGASQAHAGQAKDLEKAMNEAEMTDAQMKKREEIVKELKKKEDEFKERYGDKYKDVMYATATKMAMKD